MEISTSAWVGFAPRLRVGLKRVCWRRVAGDLSRVRSSLTYIHASDKLMQGISNLQQPVPEMT